MKSILFVINTMGMGGGEKAMLELLRQVERQQYDISLFVLTGQGELINQIPKSVKILNKQFFPISVLDRIGKVRLLKTVIQALFIRRIFFQSMRYLIKNFWDMVKKGKIQIDKLFWRILSDGAQRLEQEYDLAVAYLEGGSTYYVASHVKAKRKAAFLHTNYKFAGYTRKLDENCYLDFDHIFTVSKSVKEEFLSVYPECREYTDILYNLINREGIINKSKEKGGFSDDYNGFRILTIGRLVPEKAHDIEIRAMQILKKSGKPFKWYVLGEGELRKKLEGMISKLGLKEEFVFLGTVSNPFPYYVQCDLYVHASYLEGKSIAIEEAQILGCAILVTDYDGVKEQVEDGVDGRICEPKPEILAQNILDLANSPQMRMEYGLAASKRKRIDNVKEMNKLLNLLS